MNTAPDVERPVDMWTSIPQDVRWEKTKRYFIRTNLYKYLTENGDLERAIKNSEKLCKLCKETPEDFKAYSEIHRIIELLQKIS